MKIKVNVWQFPSGDLQFFIPNSANDFGSREGKIPDLLGTVDLDITPIPKTKKWVEKTEEWHISMFADSSSKAWSDLPPGARNVKITYEVEE